MNTRFYKEMVKIRRDNEYSIRTIAKKTGLSASMLIEFYNPTKAFRPLREMSMGKIHNNLGISYEVMEEYNEYIMNNK